MKGKFYISISIVILVIAILGWQQYEKNKEFMDSLLLHQPIVINQVDAIHLLEKRADIREVKIDDYIKVVEWFNEYEPNRVSGEKIPQPNAQVVVNTKEGETIIINYVDGEIYINRTDVGAGGIEYVFLDDAPKLEKFFKELIN
jgi:hypothetical protein